LAGFWQANRGRRQPSARQRRFAPCAARRL